MRLRFAPSPTGELHVGGARTAILNWLLARHHGGSFVLRIEDTDIDRNVADAEARILDDLRWLGLDWDEGPDVGGDAGPYRQSDRKAIHAAAARRLVDARQAYVCTCPPALDEREEGVDRGGRCPCADREPPDPVPVGASLRFRVPDERVVVDDLVRGEVSFPAGSIEDFVIVRGDGRATYNLAAVVDDAAMRITHVVRGSDHLINTPKQVLLYRALGQPLPHFAHIPLILGEDRQKLSKRHGATSVGEHRRLGYMPEALVNYLSLLSWSSASGDEFLPIERLIAEVDLERLGASDAVFDPEKLRWLSSQYIQALSGDELQERLRPFVDLERFDVDASLLPVVAELLRKRMSILSEAEPVLESFLGALSEGQREERDALLRDGGAADVLGAVRQALDALPEWTVEAVDGAIREGGKAAGVRGRALFMPVRMALTGDEHGPELGRVVVLLGRQRSLARLAGEGIV